MLTNFSTSYTQCPVSVGGQITREGKGLQSLLPVSYSVQKKRNVESMIHMIESSLVCRLRCTVTDLNYDILNKVRGNKKRNLRISLAFLLHNTVDLTLDPFLCEEFELLRAPNGAYHLKKNQGAWQ